MKPKNNKNKRRAMPLLVGVGIGYAELFYRFLVKM